MKKVSERKKKQTENDCMILEEKNLNTFSSKPNLKPDNEEQELSPIALMKHRIEEMHRKLFEKRDLRK
jgi:hypothetical protein